MFLFVACTCVGEQTTFLSLQAVLTPIVRRTNPYVPSHRSQRTAEDKKRSVGCMLTGGRQSESQTRVHVVHRLVCTLHHQQKLVYVADEIRGHRRDTGTLGHWDNWDTLEKENMSRRGSGVSAVLSLVDDDVHRYATLRSRRCSRPWRRLGEESQLGDWKTGRLGGQPREAREGRLWLCDFSSGLLRGSHDGNVRKMANKTSH